MRGVLSFPTSMMSGWFTWLAGLYLLGAIWVAPGAEAAQVPVHAAGLVIDYGDGRVSYAWVPFPEESITGIELLKRSGLSLVSVPFGGLGEGICSIEGTGCDVGECRSRLCQSGDRESPFWQYVRQDEPGRWKTIALGASQSTVRDGDIDGWAWIGTSPTLPAISMPDIAKRVGLSSAQLQGDAVPGALTVTEGDARDSPVEATWRDLAPAAGILAGVLSVGSFAVWRGRHVRRGRRPPLQRSGSS